MKPGRCSPISIGPAIRCYSGTSPRRIALTVVSTAIGAKGPATYFYSSIKYSRFLLSASITNAGHIQ
ncbi:MAG: hypothetical protein JSU03_05540 [Bacteroidetes bacterium]|nr:hypothetical protein [Bacteroidota bacterium]